MPQRFHEIGQICTGAAEMSPEQLAEERDNPWGGDDWHPTVGDCVRVILEEEWAQLRYIRRDLVLLSGQDGA